MHGAFLKLSGMKQLVEETATAYFQRNYGLCTELVECKIPLPPTLLSMFAVRGLRDQFLSVQNHFTMNPGLFASMKLSAIETFTEVHANSAKMLGTRAPDQPATYAAAAAAAAALTETSPSSETTAHVYPPARKPGSHKITKVVANADATCPVCHRVHVIVDCG